MPLGNKLSEIKTNIGNVIANLQCLEGLSNAPPNDFDLERSLQLERQTTNLLDQLTQLPCEQIVRSQRQRQRRRQRAKQRAKLRKFENRTKLRHAKEVPIPAASSVEPVVVLPVPKQAEHITLKKLHDATNMLHTFDLLERLYKARGGNKDLAEKLARMRAVWQRVQQESTEAIAQEAPTDFQAQWNKVIFGSSSVPLKQRTINKNPNSQELVQRRIIWDSYISHGKSASYIPNGWVLPPENPTPEWANFIRSE